MDISREFTYSFVKMKRSLALLILSLFLPLISLAQDQPDEREDRYVISLATINPGKELYFWWGHTGILVEDAFEDTAILYDYGKFSFHTEHFYRNFAMGRLIYQSSREWGYPYFSYMQRIGREVRVAQLDLTEQQTIELVELLETSTLPENKEYLYHHYYENCSTRLRDMIDIVLDGQLKEQSSFSRERSFRVLFRQYSSHSFWPDWGLNFLQGPNIDKPVDVWDEMFLPMELENIVTNMQIKSDNGTMKPLVSEITTLSADPVPWDIPAVPPRLWTYNLFIAMILVVSLLPIRFAYGTQGKYRKILGSYHLLWSLVTGLPGTLLFFLMFFTDHNVTYNNLNVFLANPLALAGIPLSIIFMINGKGKKYLNWLWRILSILGIIMLGIKLFTPLYQDNLRSIIFFLPVHVALALPAPRKLQQ